MTTPIIRHRPVGVHNYAPNAGFSEEKRVAVVLGGDHSRVFGAG